MGGGWGEGRGREARVNSPLSGIGELLCQLPLDQQSETVVPDCWDNFCCSQCLVLHLVIVNFLQSTFFFFSFFLSYGLVGPGRLKSRL